METSNKTPETSYKVRFSDCDLLGHLNNARYIDYFMDAREDHLKEYYGIKLNDYYHKGIVWVVSHHEIAYLRSAVYNEKVTIEPRLLSAKPDSLSVELVMMNEAKTHLKSIMRTEFTPINPKIGKRENHTAEFMQWAKTIENPVAEKSLQERIKTLRAQLKEKELA